MLQSLQARSGNMHEEYNVTDLSLHTQWLQEQNAISELTSCGQTPSCDRHASIIRFFRAIYFFGSYDPVSDVPARVLCVTKVTATGLCPSSAQNQMFLHILNRDDIILYR